MEWVLLCIIFFGSSLFHGITGFGFVIVALPLIIIFHNPHQSVFLIVFLGFINTINLAIRTWRDIIFKMVKILFVCSIFGLPCGAYLYVHFNIIELKIFISTLILLFGLLLLSKWSYQFKKENIAQACVGFLAGVFQTSVGLTGIPPAVYLTLQKYNKSSFRASINAFLLCISPIGLAVLWFLSDTSKSVFIKGVSFLPIVIIGQYVGVKLSNRVPQQRFRIIVIWTILGSALYNLIYSFAI